MKEISSKTCITFVKKASNTVDHIYIRSVQGKGCSSKIGRQGGLQYVNIESITDDPEYNCMNGGFGTSSHELIHALGFFHMQSATTRNDFITVNFENIESNKERNFERKTANEVSMYNTVYDYSSIMHYGKTAFSKNKKNTITTLDPKYQDVIGQRSQMSSGDVTRLKRMYKCPN